MRSPSPPGGRERVRASRVRHDAAPAWRGVHSRRDERMREADSLAVDSDDPRRRRLHERALDALPHRTPRRARPLWDEGEPLRASSTSRVPEPELRDASPDRVGRRGGTGIGAAGSSGNPPVDDQRGDLLAEERIPVARHVELPNDGPRKPSAGATANHCPKGGSSSGPTSTSTTRPSGAGTWVSGPFPTGARRRAPHVGLDAPQSEAERSQRRRVAPLQVVERDEHAVVRQRVPQRRRQRQAEREWIDRMRLVRVDPPERDIERPGLRRGQVELRRPERLHQFGEDAEGKLGLGLRRAGGEDSEAQLRPARPSPPTVRTFRSRRRPGIRAPGTPRGPTGGTGRSSRAPGRVRRAAACLTES